MCNEVTVYPGAATVAVSSTSRWRPRVVEAPASKGWLVVKGVLFAVRGDEIGVNLAPLLSRFLNDESIDWNIYEGTFALAMWDARMRRGIAVNDQTSIMNLYYIENADGLYVTTAALPVARALGCGLDPASTREFLARGALIAPSALFQGFRRLSVGEHLRFGQGCAACHRHWRYPQAQERWSLDVAAEEAVAISTDRMRRFGLAAGPRVITDLTSGYDSRLLASAADRAGLCPAVTVNGVPEDEEVRISHRVAEAAGWPMHHFDPTKVWIVPVGPELRRELVCRTDGNLVFLETYHHKLTRPGLAEAFDLHAAGVGGEFLRYHPWGQEFLSIGRRCRANVENVLAYRMLHDGPPPDGLFHKDWFPLFRTELFRRVEEVCAELPDSLTTQQLDAVHLWKQTGHASLYVSALFNWLPSIMPWMGVGFITVGMVTPWRYRLTTRLTRQVNHLLCPRAAAIVTRYGGTASPVSLANFHRHVIQTAKQLRHLMEKVDRVALAGLMTRGRTRAPQRPRKPYLTDEFRSFMTPHQMVSRRLYDIDGVRAFLSGDDIRWYANERLILRMANLEQICRELDFHPDQDFLCRTTGSCGLRTAV